MIPQRSHYFSNKQQRLLINEFTREIQKIHNDGFQYLLVKTV